MANLVAFCNEELHEYRSRSAICKVGSADLRLYPFIHMTGHGNVVFSSSEARNLRVFKRGGFLHISDNYGMDKFIRKEFIKVFPEHEWVEIPFDHSVYHQKFDFEQGLPKVHEHDDEPPRGWYIPQREACLFLRSRGSGRRLGRLSSTQRSRGSPTSRTSDGGELSAV